LPEWIFEGKIETMVIGTVDADIFYEKCDDVPGR
jgi:hypothetical protein